MQEIFNPQKLPDYTEKFGAMTASIVGGGAVGSYIAGWAAQMGIGHLRIYDFDTFTEENRAKHSPLIHEEDAGRNKAIAVAERVRPFMISGGTAVGIDTDIRYVGPEAFRGTDVLFVALDNYAAKIYLNQIWMQIPEKERPLMIFGGTAGESAQSHCLDGSKLCMRCTFDESWLKDGMVRTSCTGPQYFQPGSSQQIVWTSGLASGMSAHMMCEHFRGYVLGHPDVANTDLNYQPFPAMEVHRTRPRKRASCPDCNIASVEEREFLEGSVMTLTLSECMEQLRQRVGEEAVLYAHSYLFNNIFYGGIVVRQYCNCCGKVYTAARHEGDIRYEDILCEDCRNAGRTAVYDPQRPTMESLRGITPKDIPEELKDLTLFQLGWPVGGYLKAIKVEQGMDFLDFVYTEHVFALKGDREILNRSTALKRGADT